MHTTEKNKAVIRQLYEQAINQRNLGLLPELVSTDYQSPRGGQGVASFEVSLKELFLAFPDAQWSLEELIAEEDRVVVRQQMRGTHLGPFQQIPVTGKAIISNGIGIYELKNGQIVRHQILTDRLIFLQQLGILPLDFQELIGRNASK